MVFDCLCAVTFFSSQEESGILLKKAVIAGNTNCRIDRVKYNCLLPPSLVAYRKFLGTRVKVELKDGTRT